MDDRERYLPLAPGLHPLPLTPTYGSTVKRAPQKAPIVLPQTLSELTGPIMGAEYVQAGFDDLTHQHDGEPLGERIIVEGQVLDENGKPVSDTLLEMWQCNAAGRYRHEADQHDAPLDPNFSGNGRVLTDADGFYRFITIKPGAYPWRNHQNAWRPAHLHFSIAGPSMLTRLVTQMYFPGDPLLPLDPIYNSVPDKEARERLIARFSLESTKAEWALGYRFDIVLRGRRATPMES
ncbi:MAG: pcaH [Alphaproteobacteria bacterium]|jgi:protocatechuate 3,4-dioxygenase beta subunit|nr:pcaH [Alphaproteobacteria bacterium]